MAGLSAVRLVLHVMRAKKRGDQSWLIWKGIRTRWIA
jgi:hypothetical protein